MHDSDAFLRQVRVAELDWYQPQQLQALNPPFDLVIAADCIYHENIVPVFHRTVLAATGPKSTGESRGKALATYVQALLR